MVTDNQAKEAIKTIAEYCSQRTGEESCKGCAMHPICRKITFVPPEYWPDYMDEQ